MLSMILSRYPVRHVDLNTLFLFSSTQLLVKEKKVSLLRFLGILFPLRSILTASHTRET